jgi:hypothetical protein
MCLSFWPHSLCVSISLTLHHHCWKCIYGSGLTDCVYLHHWYLIMVADNVPVTLASQNVCTCLSNISSWPLTIPLWLWPHRMYVSTSLASHHGCWRCLCDFGLIESVYLSHWYLVMVADNVPVTLDSQAVCTCLTDVSSWSLTMPLWPWTHSLCVSISPSSHHSHWQCVCGSGFTGSVYLPHWYLIMVADNVPMPLASQIVCIWLTDISSWLLNMCLWLWPHRLCVFASLVFHPDCWQYSHDPGLLGSMHLMHWHSIMVADNISMILASQVVCTFITDIPL